MEVKELSADAFWKGEICISGKVEDEGHIYHTKVYIKGSQIFDYSCSCSGGNSGRTMCRHGQELYRAYQAEGREREEKAVSTSQSVRMMIREYTNRQVAEIVAESEGEDVEFLPLLLIRREGLFLEASLKRGREYLLRDLAAFAQAVREGRYVEYGRGLAFNHDLNAFTKESRGMAAFASQLALTYLDHYGQIRRGQMPAVPALRSLKLGRADADRFFELIEGRNLQCEDMRGHRRILEAVNGDPDFCVTVKKAGKGGIKVSVPPDLLVFEGEKSLYVADTKKLYRCSREYTEAMSVFLSELLKNREEPGSALVGERDIPLFYERVLKGMEAFGILTQEGVDLESARPEPLSVRFAFDCLDDGRIALTPSLSYGDYHFQPMDDGEVPKEICRDVPGEFRVSCLITRYFSAREEGTGRLLLAAGDDALYRLLDEGMEQFGELGEIWFSDRFRGLNIRRAPEISLGVSAADGWLKLTLDTGDMSGTELLKVLDAYRQKKKYYRLKNGEFLKLSDDGFMTIARLQEGLGIGKGELKEKQIVLPGYRALYLDQMVREEGGIAFYRDSLYKAVVRGMKSVADSDFEIPASFQGELREYQKTGYRWLRTLDHWGFGGILADDMGLGKTIQVIALLLSAKEEGMSLIVCPASLVYNWAHELSVFAPSLRVLTAAGSLGERRELLAGMDSCQVIVTSYDLLKRDIEIYREKSFRFEILDEAQCIKNAATKSAKAVKEVKARTRFALTGTPVENHLGELWSIFDYLMPGFLFAYGKFRTMYEIPIVKDRDERAAANLRRLIGPFLLRRLKCDVLKELPEKIERVVYSAFEGEQKKLYGANVLRLRQELEAGGELPGKIQILAGLTRLRQICCDPSLCYENYKGESAKLETCLALLSGAVAAGHRVLLFSQFASMFPIIKKRLDRAGIGCFVLTGATSKEERSRLTAKFYAGDVPVFLISLKAGGTGLNLTAADVVIHYDPWWNAAAQDQATDRAHRIGQKKQVTVFRLIMKGTVEESILHLQESKSELAERIVTEGSVSLAGLGREELLKLLEP